MILPKINKKDQPIIKYQYQFRFMNRAHIQHLLGLKDKRSLNRKLEKLIAKNYLERIYSKKIGENIKPAIFRFGLNGIRFLKLQNYASQRVILKLYRDKKRKKTFINRCLLIADICLELQRESKNGLNFSYTNESQFDVPHSPFAFLVKLSPQLMFLKQKASTENYHLLEIFDSSLPPRALRRRIKTYKDFYFSNQWEDHTKKSFPILLFIMPNLTTLISTKHFIRKLLKEEHINNLDIQLTTEQDVRKNGITAHIWE